MSDSPRSVTITADDFGLDPGVNAAITHLARTGRLHAASVLIDAPHAGAALRADLPIAVGLHVTLSGPLLATGTGTQIRNEITRQWQQMAGHGRTPAHLDLHTAALYGIGTAPVRPGGVLPEALSVAAAHRVPLRLPRILPPGLRTDSADRTQNVGYHHLVTAADKAGVRLPQTAISDFRPPGHITAYVDLRTHYREMVQALPAGHSEVFLHPAQSGGRAEDDAAAAAQRKRLWEYRLLASGDLHRDLAGAGVAT